MTAISFTIQPITIRGKRWVAGPTQNHRMNHWARHAVTKAFRLAAWAEMRRHRIEPAARILVTLVRHAVRDVDEDNLHAGFKPILDGIVDSGIVPNDSRKHVDRVVALIRVPHFDEERLEICVTPLAAATSPA